jgi:hypothetical protein
MQCDHKDGKQGDAIEGVYKMQKDVQCKIRQVRMHVGCEAQDAFQSHYLCPPSRGT